MSTTLLSASEAATERYPLPDPDQPPSDEVLLARFRSKLSFSPSEELTGCERYSGRTLAAARAAEKAEWLERQRQAWREQRESEKAVRAQIDADELRQREYAAGVYRARLTETLDSYRSLLREQQAAEQTLAQTSERQERLVAETSDLNKLAKALREAGDLITAATLRSDYLKGAQTALIEPLRQTYVRAKSEFAFFHGHAVKKHPAKKAAIDKIAAHYGLGHGYAWPHESFDRGVRDFGRDQILSAAASLEQRFQAIESLLTT